MASPLFAKSSEMQEKFESFDIETIYKDLKKSGQRYSSFLERSSLKTGLYYLKTGQKDNQQPHDLDEVYYIIDGEAKFKCDDAIVTVKPGSVLYVKAKEEHFFHDITSDMKILVFFSNVK